MWRPPLVDENSCASKELAAAFAPPVTRVWNVWENHTSAIQPTTEPASTLKNDFPAMDLRDPARAARYQHTTKTEILFALLCSE